MPLLRASGHSGQQVDGLRQTWLLSSLLAIFRRLLGPPCIFSQSHRRPHHIKGLPCACTITIVGVLPLWGFQPQRQKKKKKIKVLQQRLNPMSFVQILRLHMDSLQVFKNCATSSYCNVLMMKVTDGSLACRHHSLSPVLHHDLSTSGETRELVSCNTGCVHHVCFLCTQPAISSFEF